MVFHCYAGSAEMARELVRRGRMLSFTANITYPNAKRAYESALAVGLQHLMVETDCPYMAPQSHRGKRNDSRLMGETVATLADWFGIPYDEAARVTADNAVRFFGL
jgi:TatD DNase family protein